MHLPLLPKRTPAEQARSKTADSEEVDEALHCIENNFGTFEGNFYAINLKGHGCLVMANASKLDRMKSVKFCVRKLPEFM